MTRWAADVDPAAPLPEYPRPQMVRPRWQNLNGLWQFAIAAEGDAPPFGRALERRILVPFPMESALSGVGEHAERVWYRRAFRVPAEWSGRVLLHFGAVDWEAEVFVNGTRVGEHRGGYDAFTFDVTDALRPSGEQELVVRVYDPTDAGDQARGKQVREPRGIWYTPVTGIWQTVWLEPVPEARLDRLDLVPDLGARVLRVGAPATGARPGDRLRAVARADGRVVARAEGEAGEELRLAIPEPRLWSPDDPFLYDLDVALVRDGREIDRVASYFGMRDVALGKDEQGRTRILLNGEPVFQLGPLDQGWWPDGLYTAPTDEALRFDIEITKQLGFNMTRKHVKVEPARWYYWADRLGLPVWQDMPNADNATPEGRAQFEVELREMIEQFRSHPSIIVWVPFNEGWGQFDTERVAESVERLDPSRLVIDASGWQHVGAGDIIDVHRYQGPQAFEPEPDRAAVVGEFGGLGLVEKGHTWAEEGWGYQGTYETREALAERYETLLNRLLHSEETHGISAGVYTQITDVEIEVNGLLTYDRAVLKIDTARLAAIHAGLLPLILPEDGRFVDRATVSIFTGADEAEVRYTTDGGEPTAASARYTEPFPVTASTTVRARAFVDGRPVPFVATRVLEKVEGRPAQEIAGAEPGLDYTYYEGTADDAPYRRHWQIRNRLNTIRGGPRAIAPTGAGTVPEFTLAPARRDEVFGFQFTGYIRVPRDGVYTFTALADDGARLWIGDEQVIEPFGQSPKMTESWGSVPLRAGYHPITLNYFQAYGPHGLELYVEGPGLPRQRVPASMLFRARAAE